jgi:hypothetical protein
MRRLRRALRERRVCQARLRQQRHRAMLDAAELRRQYRVQPALPLGVAAAGGFALGRSRLRWRPPRGVMNLAWRWGLVLLRNLL